MEGNQIKRLREDELKEFRVRLDRLKQEWNNMTEDNLRLLIKADKEATRIKILIEDSELWRFYLRDKELNEIRMKREGCYKSKWIEQIWSAAEVERDLYKDTKNIVFDELNKKV